MTGPSSRVPALLVLVWLGGLLLATSVGLLAVRLVAAQVGDPAVTPLTEAAARVAASPSPAAVLPSAAPVPSSSISPSPAPAASAAATATRTFSTAAGTLGVSCAGEGLRLLYATPAPGYALDERSVAGSEAEVRFEGAGSRVRLRLSCASGVPRLVEQRIDPDGGGGDDSDDDEPDD